MAGYQQQHNETTYENGHCDFCKQRNVKVKPLHCKSHFYCRTCNDFSPKFQRQDFECRTCSESRRRIVDKNLQKVDSFLENEAGGKPSKDVTVSIERGNIITFGKDNSCELDDDNDGLTGNNDDWEYLLQTIAKEEVQKDVQQDEGEKKKYTSRLQLVPREMSVIKLVLPSADPKYQDKTDCSTPSNGFGNNRETSKGFISNEKPKQDCKGKTPDEPNEPGGTSSAGSSFNMHYDSLEEERGTSPIKSLRAQRKPAWGWFPSSHIFVDDGDDDDDTIELLTDIEAPPESPRFLDEPCTTPAKKDSFWDF